MKSLPNVLTIIRMVMIPMLLAALCFFNSWLTVLLLAVALLTDFFDGLLARSLHAQSSFGRIIDPIADKLLITSLLVMLVYLGKAPVIASLLIICREILVSGLREYLSEFKISIPVTKIAKLKTTLQFIAIFLLILGNENGSDYFLKTTYYIGEISLWIAALLTIMTGYTYLKEGFAKIQR